MDLYAGHSASLSLSFLILKNGNNLVVLGAGLRQGPVESMGVKESDAVPDSKWGSER